MRKRLLGFLVSLWLVPTLGWALPLPRATAQQAQPEKKKTRKVWTNDDLSALQQSRGVSVVGTPPPAPKEERATPAAGGSPGEDIWAQLDKLREERNQLAGNLQTLREVRNDKAERARLAPTADLREGLEEDVALREQEIVAMEAKLKELDERLPALEKQTKGRRRPKSRAPAKAAAPPPSSPSPPQGTT